MQLISDLNECQELNGGCLRHAVCLNTIGSHTCTCLDGTPGDYGGKKKQCIGSMIIHCFNNSNNFFVSKALDY